MELKKRNVALVDTPEPLASRKARQFNVDPQRVGDIQPMDKPGTDSAKSFDAAGTSGSITG